MRIRDWSSDVCSSYLSKRAFSLKAARRNQHLPLPFVSRRRDMMVSPTAAFALPLTLAACALEAPPETPPQPAAAYMSLGTEIGTAPCRERVCQYVSISVCAVSYKNKRKQPDVI